MSDTEVKDTLVRGKKDTTTAESDDNNTGYIPLFVKRYLCCGAYLLPPVVINLLAPEDPIDDVSELTPSVSQIMRAIDDVGGGDMSRE